MKNKQQISDLEFRNNKLAHETDQLRELFTTDKLTNAFNRHGIEKIINSLIINRTPAAIIMMDIDYFKFVNDNYGHDTGDRVLTRLSELMIQNTRASDRFGRWGGEEFILICPDTCVNVAARIAEKLRTMVVGTIFEPDNPIALTVSFGVATFIPGEPFASAFKRADEALYCAKSQGRNRVITATQDQAQETS